MTGNAIGGGITVYSVNGREYVAVAAGRQTTQRIEIWDYPREALRGKQIKIMTPNEDKEDFAFAEAVRKQSLRITTLITEGKSLEAGDVALLLCRAAERRKNRILRSARSQDTP